MNLVVAVRNWIAAPSDDSWMDRRLFREKKNLVAMRVFESDR